MKPKLSLHLLLRLLSAVMMPVLVVIDLLFFRFPDPFSLGTDIWWSIQMILLYPASHEPVNPSFIPSGISVALALALKVASAAPGIHVAAGAAVVLLFIMHKSRVRFSDIPPLFHVSAVWKATEDYFYMVHVAICFWAGAMLSVFTVTWAGWTLVALLAALYALQYARTYLRTTIFLGLRRETQIRKTQRGSAFKQPVQYVDSDSRSAELFNEIVRIMETRRPWLQDDFGIDDLARLAHSNRMYVSRAINFHSGRNFNQLVNYYRICYAADLLAKDPGLRMNEISQMCGFHTVVSFNTAFKLNKRMTPMQFAQSLKSVQP